MMREVGPIFAAQAVSSGSLMSATSGVVPTQDGRQTVAAARQDAQGRPGIEQGQVQAARQQIQG